MNPLSPDLRKRIITAYENNEGSQAELAERFKVGKASVERLVRLKRETGSIEPRPHAGGTPRRITEADRVRLIEDFEREPDLRQADIAARLTEEGRPVSQRTVSRALRRLGITRKKRP
jgi:transposase